MPRIFCYANHYINAVFEYGTPLFAWWRTLQRAAVNFSSSF